jgi:hypothetical protein
VLAYQLFLGDLTIWPGPDMADDLRALGLPSAVVTLLRNSVSQNPAKRPADALEWKLVLEAHTTRGGSDTKPNAGINTPTPGTLRIDDPGTGPS